MGLPWGLGHLDPAFPDSHNGSQSPQPPDTLESELLSEHTTAALGSVF